MLGKNSLLAAALLIVPIAASASAVASMQAAIVGRPSTFNSKCSSDCIRQFRADNQLMTAFVGRSGQIIGVSSQTVASGFSNIQVRLPSTNGKTMRLTFAKKPTSIPVSLSGKPGPRNAGCSANCVKQFRSNGFLTVVALDRSGHIAMMKRVWLSSSAQFVATSRGLTKKTHSGQPGAQLTSGMAAAHGQNTKSRSKEVIFHDHYKSSDGKRVVTIVKKYRGCDSDFQNCAFDAASTKVH